MTIGNRARDLPDGERIEVVVDEDRSAEGRREDLSAATGRDLRHRPFRECSRAAGHEDEGGDDAECEEEDEDQDVVGVDRALGPEDLREGVPHEDGRSGERSVGHEEGRGDDAGGERGEHAFRRDDEEDRENRRDQSEKGVGLDHGALLDGDGNAARLGHGGVERRRAILFGRP